MTVPDTISPVNFYRRPKPFDRDAASREYEDKHPEFRDVTEQAQTLDTEAAGLVVHADNPAAFFTTRFGWIHARRMQGLPIINTNLAVRALPFEKIGRGSDAFWFGVVVTPWSVQAVVVPAPETDWAYAPPGTGVDEALPGGDFAFVACEDPLLGQYRMCSLKSPVFEFSDQETAEAFALACLNLMLGRHPVIDEPETPGPNLTQLARERTAAERRGKPADQQTGEEKTISRRALFSRIRGK